MVFSAGGILCGEMLLGFDGLVNGKEIDVSYVPDDLDKVSADVTVESHALEGWPHGFGAADGKWILDFDRWLTEAMDKKNTTSKTYKVTFKNGTKTLTIPMLQTISYHSKVVKPTKNPTKNGYTFIGWYTSESHTKKFNFDKEKITINTSIYAYFIKNYAAPAKSKVTKEKAGIVKISWQKKSGYFYEIQWSKKRTNFNKLKTTTKSSFIKSGLKKGIRYYFKVRTYKAVAGVNIYGKYTKVKFKKA